MRMRTLLAGLMALNLGLAASAQQAKDENARRTDRNDAAQREGTQQTIRGVISGVTAVGEMRIDPQANRAIAAELDYLTVVGSPRHDMDRDRDRDQANRDQANRDADRDRDRDRDRADRRGMAGRNRHNVYILSISPRTTVRDASHQGDRDRNRDQANRDRDRDRDRDRADNNAGTPASLEALEIGDRVEVTFNLREPSNANANAANAGSGAGAGAGDANARNQRYGRHRTYFGDAVSITILGEPRPMAGRGPGDRGNDRDQDRDRDRARPDADRPARDSNR